MAAVTGPGEGEVPGWWAERNNKQAAQLLNLLQAAKPVEKTGAPSLPHLGGDHPKPQGLLVAMLFGPFVWPVDSETQLANDAETLKQEAKFYEDQAMEARRRADQVFGGGAWEGESAQAAEAAYSQAVSAKFDQSEVARVGSGLLARASSDVERTKRQMTGESDAAHKEAEVFLRSGSGQSIAAVGAIVSQHRTMIQAQSADLHGHVANDTRLFTQKFPQSPGGGLQVKQAGGNGLTSDPSPDGGGPAPGRPAPGGPLPGLASGHSPGGENIPLVPGGRTVGHSPDGGPAPVPHSPLTSLMGAGSGLPSLPSVPGGGGGSGLPFSGLQGLLGGFGGFPGGGCRVRGAWLRRRLRRRCRRWGWISGGDWRLARRRRVRSRRCRRLL